MTLRVLVTGGRKFDRQDIVDKALDRVLSESPDGLSLIHGGAGGADACANAWAYARKAVGAPVEVHSFPAEWRAYGLSAGPRRNQQMVDAQPDLVVAFPGDKGTADCVRRAEAAGIKVQWEGQDQ